MEAEERARVAEEKLKPIQYENEENVKRSKAD